MLYENPIEPEPGQILWRYISLDKFNDLINTSSLFFSFRKGFADKEEGRTTDNNISSQIDAYMNKMISVQMLQKLMLRSNNGVMIMGRTPEEFVKLSIKKIEGDVNDIAISCWHINCNEEQLMWKNYAGDNGIAIVTTYGQLKKELVSISPYFSLSKVKYVDYDKASFNAENAIEYVLHKGKIFATENELRACIGLHRYSEEFLSKDFLIETNRAEWVEEIKLLEKLREDKLEKGIKIKVNLNNLINNVFVQRKEQLTIIEEILIKNKLNAKVNLSKLQASL